MEHSYYKKYFEAILGIALVTFALDLIILPMNIVYGGTGGLAVIFKAVFGVDTTLFITLFYIVMIILNFFIFGLKDTQELLLFSFLYPVFTKAFEIFPSLIPIDYETNIMSLYIFAAVLLGAGNGLIFKNGFIVGGTDVLKKILSSKFDMSMGTSTFIIDAIIVIIGGYFFGLISVIYAIILIYLASKITDMLILGIGMNKTFYIITENDEAVRKYIKEQLNISMTEIEAYGFTNNKKHILMTVIPTRKYLLLKENICKIDENAFIVIENSYHLYHGGE